MPEDTKKRGSYGVNGLLASGVLYYALKLSEGDRGTVDYVVIGLVVAAILWNVVQLSRRLHSSGGARDVWHVQRTVLFWIVGVFNTAMLRPEDVGSWKNWVGWAFLAIAAIDTVALLRKEARTQPAADG